MTARAALAALVARLDARLAAGAFPAAPVPGHLWVGYSEIDAELRAARAALAALTAYAAPLDCCDAMRDAVRTAVVVRDDGGAPALMVVDADGTDVSRALLRFCPWCGAAAT